MALYQVKKNKLWVIKALERGRNRVVAWVLGKRDTATFERLYNKVKHLENCIFYTDDWEPFKAVLPPERHVIGKKHTHLIESNNSSVRDRLGRFVRKTKVVSQNEYAVHLALKLWSNLKDENIFREFQSRALAIYM